MNRVEQFIMSYGGLRGAVAFALILIINRQIIHAREMMVTTIIAVVYFTVFLQGMTVGTLVKILNVPRANKFELTMNERIHTRVCLIVLCFYSYEYVSFWFSFFPSKVNGSFDGWP